MHQMVLLNNGISSNAHIEREGVKVKYKVQRQDGGHGHMRRNEDRLIHVSFSFECMHKVSRRILVKCSCELQQISVQLISRCVCVCVYVFAILSYILAFKTRLEHSKLVSF